jgi:hypothetical protein
MSDSEMVEEIDEMEDKRTKQGGHTNEENND